MKFHIVHSTRYDYSDEVTVSHHAARMSPRVTAHQSPKDFTLQIEPAPAVQRVHKDYFGNSVCVFSIQGLHRHLVVKATSTVEITIPSTQALVLSPGYEDVRRMFLEPVAPAMGEPYEFVFDSLLVGARQEYAAYALESFKPSTPVLQGVRDLTRRIHKDFKFDPKATTVATPLEEVWTKRRGVCQDFAHIAIACLRSVGLPARYVSGYLRTKPPPGKPRLRGADQSHAWFSAFCPNAGWVDFDPTNDCLAGEEHPVVAYGRDFSDVSPLAGIITGGGEHVVSVGVDVEEV